MKNRLAGLEQGAPTASIPATPTGQMSPALQALVNNLVNSGREAMKDHGTDLNIVTVVRGGPRKEDSLMVAAWRTPHGLMARAEQLRLELADKAYDHLCVCGPHGPDGDTTWFVYAEDSGGCWFSLLPLTHIGITDAKTFGQPSFRPGMESDGFYNILPSVLS